MKSRRSLIGSQTDLYGSTDSSWPTLVGAASARTRPDHRAAHGSVPSTRSAPEAAKPSHQRSRGAGPGTSWQRPHFASLTPPCAARGVGQSSAQPRGQRRRSSRTRRPARCRRATHALALSAAIARRTLCACRSSRLPIASAAAISSALTAPLASATVHARSRNCALPDGRGCCLATAASTASAATVISSSVSVWRSCGGGDGTNVPSG